MKFMMIFEGVDRASKIMNKIMSSEKKAATAVKTGAKASERATDAAARATQKQASALSKVGSAARSAYAAVQRGAQAAARSVVDLHRKTVALAKAGLGNIKGGAGKVMRGVGVAGGIAVAVSGSAVLAANQLVGTASQFEKFQTVLETTEGSAGKARAAMGWVTDFAARTPYELEGVMASFVKLRSYGLDPTQGLLKSLGDTSAAMDKPLIQAVEAVADAVTGENERLKDFGITSSKAGGMIAYNYTNAAGKGMTAMVKANDRMAIQAKLMEIFNEKYGVAMEKLSGTWAGMLSNLSDVWSQFQLAIMNAGLFDWMKEKLAGVLKTINEMKDSGELDKWAASIGQRIQAVLEATWAFAVGLHAVLEKVGGYLSTAAKYVGGWENFGTILAGLAFAPVLVSTAAGLVQIAMGLTMITAALIANPIVLLIAAIVAGAVAIYVYWEPIKAFFLDIWNAIASGAAHALQWLTSVLGFDPIAALSAGWSSLADFFARWWASLPALEWDGLIPKLSWANALTVLDWVSWISPLRWLDLIPGFSWSGIIGGALDWAAYVGRLDWAQLVPSFSWSAVMGAAGDLASYLNLASIAPAVRAQLDTVLSVVTGVWNRLKVIFEWSPVETIKAAWAGISDLVGGLVDGVVAKAAATWEGVKSIFTFGGDAAPSIDIADPATIKATAAATAALKADLQSVAAIDTGPAMARLTALDQAAARIKRAVTGSITQAQAFLSNVSFYNQGAALMDTMAAGIRARAAVVVAEITKMAQAVRDHLPSSPAKVGPLSDIHRLKFAETIAASIRPAPMVKAMRAAAAATMAAAAFAAPAIPVLAAASAIAAPSAQVARAEVARASLGSGNSASAPVIHFSPTVTVPAGAAGSPAEVEEAVQRALRASARELAAMLDEEYRRRARREF